MDRTRLYSRVGSRPDRRYRQYGNMRRPCLVRIISVPQLLNCFHTLLFSSVTLTPLKVSAAGKSVSTSGPPNVVDSNAGSSGGDSDMLTRLVPVHVRESAADAICEVAGLGSADPLKVVGDVTAGLAGLASAGEEIAELQSLLAMETAFVSISVSLVKFGLVVVWTRGVKEGMVVGGAEEGISVKLPSPVSNKWWSSIDAI